MRNLVFAATLLFAPLAIGLPQTAVAQTVASDAAVYDGVIEAIVGNHKPAAIARTAQIVADHVIASSPVVAETASGNPAFARELATAMVPALTRQNERLFAAYRPRYVALLRQNYTPEEAQEIADFFSSPIGQRIVRGAVENTSMESTLNAAQGGLAPNELTLAADIQNSADRTVQQMSDAELEHLGRLAIANPDLVENIMQIGPLLLPLRTQMENEPLTATEEKLVTNGIASVFARYGLETARQ